jgi:hypothetical protein
MAYTPELDQVHSGILRRIAWALSVPMTTAIQTVMKKAATAIVSPEKACAACKDNSFCDRCPFQDADRGKEPGHRASAGPGKHPIYIIANPNHSLGFMVASPDDPIGYVNPIEAVSELGQMRQDYKNPNLALYRAMPVTGVLTKAADLKAYHRELGIDDFDYGSVIEYIE